MPPHATITSQILPPSTGHSTTQRSQAHPSLCKENLCSWASAWNILLPTPVYIYIYIKHLEQFLTHTNTVYMAVIVIINIYSSGYLLFATASRKIFLSP